MNRRTLLTSISVGAATVAGCTGRDENDGRKYEECNHIIIEYRTLPKDVKTEVDTALDEGQYESNGQLLWEQVAGSRVEWLFRGSYYTPQVDVDNGVHTLQFEETTPQYDSTKHLTVGDVPEVPMDLSITITDSEGTVLEEADITVEGGGSRPEVPVANEFGRYTVEVAAEDWGTVTEELTLHPGQDTMILHIDEDEENKSSLSAFIAIDPDEGEAVCPWE